MNSSGCMPPLDSMVFTRARHNSSTTKSDCAKHRVDLSLPAVFQKEPATTSGTKAAEDTDFLRLRSDHDLLQFTQQLFAISQRQPHSFWRQLSNWPLKLRNFDDVRLAPIGDGFDADDDFHRLPRQAGNASILDTQTAYPRFLTLAPLKARGKHRSQV